MRDLSFTIGKPQKYCDFTGYYFFLTLFLNNKIVVDIVRLLALNYFPSMVGIIETVRNLLYSVCFLYVLALIFSKNISLELFIVASTLVLIVLLSAILSPGVTLFWRNGLLILFSRVFVGYFLFRYAEDYDKIARYQSYFLFPTLLYMILLLILGQTDNYMSTSYNLVPLGLFFIFYGLTKKRKLYLVSGILMCITVVLFGARGAMLCGLVSIFAYILIDMYNKKLTKKKLLSLFLGVTVVTAFVLNFNKIILWLYSKNETSRTLKILVSGNVLSDSNRSTFQTEMLKVLGDRIFLPRGIFSDRLYMSQITGMPLAETLYPHNLVIEVLYQYGILIGSLFLLLMLVLLVKAFMYVAKTKDNAMRVVFFSYVIVAFLQLMMSSSYLISAYWGIAMGICVSFGRKSVREFRS